MEINQPLHELLGRGNAVVLVVPVNDLPALFAGGPEAAEDPFVPDLTIAQYKERYEPNRSESRIRELCAAGVFPDTPDTEADGEVIPGAYKDEAGEWRITLEGIIARQRRERRHGLDQRVREADRRKNDREQALEKVEVETCDADPDTPDGGEQSDRATRTRADTQSGKGTPAARPRKGAWRRAAAPPGTTP